MMSNLDERKYLGHGNFLRLPFVYLQLFKIGHLRPDVPLLQFPLVIVKTHPAGALHASHYIVYARLADHHFS